MRIIRFKSDLIKDGFGWLLDEMVGNIEGNIFDEYIRLEASYPLDQVTLLPPVIPGKIICVGRNFPEHAVERNVSIPESPLIFLKPPSSVIGPGEKIVLPPQSKQVEHEVELVLIIGKKGKWIPLDRSLEHIFGYTIGNDITARDLQSRDGQWTRAKGFDTFCPIGPWIETELEPIDLMISCSVNGILRQMGSTRDMVFNIQQLISYISTVMTLNPGDLIFTGTPAGVDQLMDGDILESQVEGIGTLRNPVTSF